MEFGFREIQADYASGSQRARVWTEQWVSEWVYCPNCGNRNITQLPPNMPVADFYCTKCGDQYELKSQKRAFGPKFANGAYDAKCQRLRSDTNPNFILLNYDFGRTSVQNVCFIPKHFFTPDIVEKRKPLAPTARRAGWIGSNILLDKIPRSGWIYLVRDGVALPKDLVLQSWKQTLFIRDENLESRGWLLDVLRCVEAIGSMEFDIDQVYAFEQHLATVHPNNNNIRPKIRQQLQRLRDNEIVDFTARGRYRLKGISAQF